MHYILEKFTNKILKLEVIKGQRFSKHLRRIANSRMPSDDSNSNKDSSSISNYQTSSRSSSLNSSPSSALSMATHDDNLMYQFSMSGDEARSQEFASKPWNNDKCAQGKLIILRPPQIAKRILQHAGIKRRRNFQNEEFCRANKRRCYRDETKDSKDEIYDAKIKNVGETRRKYDLCSKKNYLPNILRNREVREFFIIILLYLYSEFLNSILWVDVEDY